MDIKNFLLCPGSGVQNSGCVPAGATYRMLPHVAAGYVGCFHCSYGFKCFHLLLGSTVYYLTTMEMMKCVFSFGGHGKSWNPR